MKMSLDFCGDRKPGKQYLEEYCCERMKNALEGGFYDICYESKYDSFSCERRDCGVYWDWEYCPFCRRIFKPKYKQYAEVLKKEFGIDEDSDEIPEEFKSDEWWKKRGL